MKIKHLIIENFRAIERLELDCSEGVNAFIGDNGAGKSTVLEAVALLYSWLGARFNSPKGNGQKIRKEDVRSGSEYCFLSIEVEHIGMTASWSLLNGNPPVDGKERKTDLRQIFPLVIHIRDYNEVERFLFAVYGVNRNISSITVNKRVYGKKEDQWKAANYSFANTNWKQFFNWYYERENEETVPRTGDLRGRCFFVHVFGKPHPDRRRKHHRRVVHQHDMLPRALRLL